MTSRALQNFCVLPEDPKNRFLDIELVWRLRQKEGLRNVRGTIRRKLKQNESASSFEESVFCVLAEAI